MIRLDRLYYSTEMARLACCFGRALSEKQEILDEKYKRLKHIDNLAFQKTIDWLIDNKDRYPVVSEILGASLKFQKREDTKRGCGYKGCSDGLVTLIFKPHKLLFSVICPNEECEAGAAVRGNPDCTFKELEYFSKRDGINFYEDFIMESYNSSTLKTKREEYIKKMIDKQRCGHLTKNDIFELTNL